MLPVRSELKSVQEQSAGWWSGLPSRDLILLPLLSVLTILVMFSVAEIAARRIFPNPEFDDCVIWHGPIGPYMKPNCVSYERTPESPRIKNVYNACGYRSLAPCGPKPAGTIRLAILGSSAAEALLVPMNQTYAELASKELTRICRRPVEFEELAAPLSSLYNSLSRVPEALRQQPDAVVLILTPRDLEALLFESADANEPHAPQVSEHVGLYKRLQTAVLNSRTALGVEHYFFESPDTYARFYLLYGDKADFLRQPFTPAWRQRFTELDGIIARVAGQLRAANVPLFVAAAPSRAVAALLAPSSKQPGVNAVAWGDRVGEIAEAHGARYIDLLRAFHSVRRSERLFYVVDGHLNAAAQPVMSTALVQALLKADIPGFAVCHAKAHMSADAAEP
jgi:hypothetical protein